MRYLKSCLMLLSAALMSSGCEQRAAENFTSALALAKAKMNGGGEASEIAMACPAPADHHAELLRLRQQLQQAQQKLAEANAALVVARNQLKTPTALTPQAANTLEQKQAALSLERRVTDATTRHVNQLEQRLSEQDLQLSELHKSLLQTEADCREIADELAHKSTSS